MYGHIFLSMHVHHHTWRSRVSSVNVDIVITCYIILAITRTSLIRRVIIDARRMAQFNRICLIRDQAELLRNHNVQLIHMSCAHLQRFELN